MRVIKANKIIGNIKSHDQSTALPHGDNQIAAWNGMIVSANAGKKSGFPLKIWGAVLIIMLTFALAGCDTGDDGSSSATTSSQSSTYPSDQCGDSAFTPTCINSSGEKVDTNQWKNDQKDQQQQQADQSSQQQAAQQAQEQADQQARQQAQDQADQQARQQAQDQADQQAREQADQQARQNQSN